MKKVLYTGKWMLTGNGEIIEDFEMCAAGKTIISVKKKSEVAEVTEYDERIDLGNAYVVPGFIDSHVHILCGISRELEDYTSEERRVSNVVCQGALHARELLEAGIVACRDLGAYRGYSLGIRDSILRGEIKGPKIVACGHAISTTGGHGFDISYEADGVDAMRKAVRQVVKDGGDVVKIMVSGGVNSPGPEPGPSEFTPEEIAAGIETAHAWGRKAAVHAHGNSAIRYCVEAGVDSVEHGVYLTEDIMDQMVEKGTFLVPTLCAPYYAVEEGLRREPENPDHNKSKEVLGQHREVLKRCAEKGVNIAFGTDAGSPFNPYKDSPYEMVLMVEAGLTPKQALTAATMGSARLLEIQEEYGSLEAGKRASFVVLKGNPLEDIGHVVGERIVFADNEKVGGDQ